MMVIENIKIKAANVTTEININLLNQANLLYQLLDQALPPGQLKEDALQFTARKRDEYAKRVVTHGRT